MKKVRIGIVGLGRLGMKHAENIAVRTAGGELAAVCALEPDRVRHACETWGVPQGYDRFDAMLENDSLDAIFIASSSAEHCRQIRQALDAGFHVFSEKPLGVSLEECLVAEESVERHPDLVFMLGFMRRYDASYSRAKKLIDDGRIGRPILFRGYSVDPESAIEGAIRFAPSSGGQFLDMSVHDIDLARWMMGAEATTVFAAGGCYAHPEFARYGDGDNLAALLRFDNDAMAFLLAGRTAAHGYAVETEIIGTKAALRVATVPQKDMVELLDDRGAVRECSQSFLERFDAAYRAETQEFVDCIREKRRPQVTVRDGVMATKVAFAAMQSFRRDELVRIS
ncbi:MAG TPA: Gfo/Idh/MocA family oxidoreductase [Spirochaetia bacterium]|nr:Gfo/Idh/MocA family oxidoreductase [Spirochaetia bacterium]